MTKTVHKDASEAIQKGTSISDVNIALNFATALVAPDVGRTKMSTINMHDPIAVMQHISLGASIQQLHNSRVSYRKLSNHLLGLLQSHKNKLNEAFNSVRPYYDEGSLSFKSPILQFAQAAINDSESGSSTTISSANNNAITYKFLVLRLINGKNAYQHAGYSVSIAPSEKEYTNHEVLAQFEYKNARNVIIESHLYGKKLTPRQ